MGSRKFVSCGTLVSHVTFGFAGPETWSVVSCGLMAIWVWQSVSSARLPDRSSRKVGVRPCWRTHLLDNGTPERPWPTTKSMYPKAAWCRAQNMVDMGEANIPPPQAVSSLWRALVMRSRPLSVANNCRVKKSAVPDHVCSTAYPHVEHGLRRLSVGHQHSRRLFIWEAKSWSYGAHDRKHTLASNCVKWCASGVRANQHWPFRLCPPVRSE